MVSGLPDNCGASPCREFHFRRASGRVRTRRTSSDSMENKEVSVEASVLQLGA
ncbi:hypothetical protein EGR_06321 [Echinococcus granulosus]|uniref:Uncharacterized protein n=1 Tax=Echinococcus granulosus TaxID=6210 RepID=W6UKZ9_ECHGR|nr:hypothetical protein EGR_06321 [Echinococcus granulosus]EUB58772.1 hypothetical protein EGR_06321 [Echinococcus granulosus]